VHAPVLVDLEQAYLQQIVQFVNTLENILVALHLDDAESNQHGEDVVIEQKVHNVDEKELSIEVIA
jgi:hypothetical protein